jgi:DNA-binding response OmpR family regulator
MEQTKILIVEDDTDQLVGLKIRLLAHQYAVVHASDGVSAISVARKECPDIILLDIGLPAGDGFVVMQRLHNLADVAHVPIIVISARDAASNAERAINAGAYAFLQKPVDNQVLLGTIESALEMAL